MPKIQNSGPKIQMDPCIDCKKPWEMFQSEKDWWEKEGKAQNLKFPRRCPVCRTEKRGRFQQKESISEKLKAVSDRVYNREYASNEDELAAELAGLAEEVSQLEHRRGSSSN